MFTAREESDCGVSKLSELGFCPKTELKHTDKIKSIATKSTYPQIKIYTFDQQNTKHDWQLTIVIV
jgi:hypothetical protein